MSELRTGRGRLRAPCGWELAISARDGIAGLDLSDYTGIQYKRFPKESCPMWRVNLLSRVFVRKAR